MKRNKQTNRPKNEKRQKFKINETLQWYFEAYQAPALTLASISALKMKVKYEGLGHRLIPPSNN